VVGAGHVAVLGGVQGRLGLDDDDQAAREVDQELFAEAARTASGKRTLPAAPLLRLETFTEGLAAQVLHVGPYAAEGPTIQRLHAFIAEHGYERTGKHHEIYLGDPRRSAPEKLRTIVRQPVVVTG
jgi:hypothetical protein